LLAASSVLFEKTAGPVDMRNPYAWWTYVRGAEWTHPRGPGSSLEGLEDHPVVHIAFEDAEAYAKWANKELPTEAEWEFAARGGLEAAAYVWGDDYMPGGKPMANTWQGAFPWQNLLDDGYEWTAPVGSFPANGYGLYDMAGNVWEWTLDWYQHHDKIEKACCTIVDPRGGTRDGSLDPRVKGTRKPRKVMKGGSYLCAPNYCQRYRPAARMAPACWLLSAFSPAVRREMKAISRCCRSSSVTSSNRGGCAPGKKIGSSPLGGVTGLCALAGAVTVAAKTIAIVRANPPKRMARGNRRCIASSPE